MADDIDFYVRQLPHWQPPGCIMFVTFRIGGSLPKEVEERLVNDARRLKADFASSAPDCPLYVLAWKKLFKYADENLHSSNRGCILQNRALGSILAESIRYGEQLGQYRLHRYCIMPNHVHMLVEPMPLSLASVAAMPAPAWPPLFYAEETRPLVCEGGKPEELNWRPIRAIMKSMKGATARKINVVRGTSGNVWSSESYDHWIRNGEEYERVVAYIDENPWKAGFCRDAGDWKLGSACEVAAVRR